MNAELRTSIVFIPGWGADLSTWSVLIKQLDLPEHFDIHLLPLPYESTVPLGSVQQEVAALAEQLADNSIVVAWSLGGMMACEIAAHFPKKIQSLFLLASNINFVAKPHWPSAMNPAVFSQFCQGFDEAPEKIQKRFLGLQVQGLKERRKLAAELAKSSAIQSSNYHRHAELLQFLADIDNAEAIKNISVPMHYVFGDSDSLVPAEAAAALQAYATSYHCNITVDILQECGHVPHISHATQVAHLLKNFILSCRQENHGGALEECLLSSDRALYKREKKRIAASFSKASLSYDDYAHLQLRVAKRLCAWAPKIEGCVLDLGCGTGFCIDQLASLQNIEQLVGLDIALDMLHVAKQKALPATWCNADIEHLPFKDNSFDWIVSSLAIQWCDQLESMFEQMAAVLADKGSVLLSSLGPDTLCELSAAWHKADAQHVHVNEFVDASVVEAAAAKAGFELMLFSVEYYDLEYDEVMQLMRDLKGIGAHNINSGSNRGLTGRAVFNALDDAYERMRKPNGKLPASYQVYFWQFTKTNRRTY